MMIKAKMISTGTAVALMFVVLAYRWIGCAP